MEDNRQSTAAPGSERIQFTGSGGEYFRIWIVNLALSLVTLGIYSAWAKVRRLQYFYGNTRLAGHAFAYHGQPLAILKGRLIGAAALAVYVGVSRFAPVFGGVIALAFVALVPWVATRARVFQLRMTSFRGVRFDFRRDYGGAYKTLLLAPLLSVLSLGLAFPWAVRLRYRWLIGNSAYGNTDFKLDLGLKPFVIAVYRTMGVALVLVLIGFGFFMLVGAVASILIDDPLDGEQLRRTIWAAMAIGLYVPILIGSYIVLAYWRRSVLNAALPATTVGPLRLHCALSARKLAWIYVTNILGIVVTLGLFTPWARVRSAKYLLESTGYVAEGAVDEFVATQVEQSSALGEEVGELFDVNVEI